MDGTINMGFRSKVGDDVRLGNQRLYRRTIAYVRLDETIARMRLKTLQVRQVPGVSKLI